MKPYGMSYKDHENCHKGCCAGNHVKLTGEASVGVRTRRKTARQHARREIELTLHQMLSNDNSYVTSY